jgi:hypothetical protein
MNPVFQNHFINNLAAKETFPSPEISLLVGKPFIIHPVTTAKTFHKLYFSNNDATSRNMDI